MKEAYEDGWIQSKLTPSMEVLSLDHRGPPERLRETRARLSAFAREHALISDEFTREVYPDWPNPQGALDTRSPLLSPEPAE